MEYIETNNFGLVDAIDYNNQKFWFLKKDKGIPVIYDPIKREDIQSGTDSRGNRLEKLKKTDLKEIPDLRVIPAYLEWVELKEKRAYVKSLESQSLDDLANNENISKTLDANRQELRDKGII